MTPAESHPDPSGDESASRAGLVDEATHAVPYPHREYVCPDCERTIPVAQQNILAKPAANAHLLFDVLKCPFCSCIFSPKTAERTVLKIPLPEGGGSFDVDATEIARLYESTRVTVPYPHRLYLCPECQRDIPTRAQVRLAKPARHAHELNDIMKCPYCNFLFAPATAVATVLRG